MLVEDAATREALRRVARGRSWARGTGIVVASCGALVVAGHLFGRALLPIPLEVGLAILVAGLGLHGVAVAQPSLRRSRGARLAGLATLAVSGFALRQPHSLELESAIALGLVAVALLLAPSKRNGALVAAHALAAVTVLIAIAILFGHVYSVRFLFGVAAYTRMSAGTALSLLGLGLGLLFAQPDRGLMTDVLGDSAGGFMARRLYPVVVCMPLLLGWLTLLGEQHHLFNGKFGLSLFVIVCIVVFVVMVAVTNRSLDRSDRARRRLAAVLLEENERRHLARELHDEIGQSLTALKVRLEMLATSAPPGLAETRALVDELMRRVSSLSLDLRPAMLDDLGLLPALVWLCERYTAETKVEVELVQDNLEERFARECETAAYRIVQEALSNVARHARIDRVTVRVLRRSDRVSVHVEDHGKGFDPGQVLRNPRTSGLIGMRERAAALGGTLELESIADGGTRLWAELPIEVS